MASKTLDTTFDVQYKSILTSNGIHDAVSAIIVRESEGKGNALASITQNVTIKFVEGSKRDSLNLFVKLHTDNPSYEEFLRELKAFQKESTFFNEYLPEALKLCEQYGMEELMKLYPKCYFANENCIILENFGMDKGFEMLPHTTQHDLDTASIVLASLARHHALSKAVMLGFKNESSFVKRFPSLDYVVHNGPIMGSLMENFFENALQTNMIILKKNLGHSGVNADVISQLEKFRGKSLEMSLKSIKCGEQSKYRVLCHGDFKNNNMMFRKRMEEDTKTVDHVLIDFQTVCCNSPALDIVSYLYSSVDPNTRQTKSKVLLETYISHLNTTCESLGFPSSVQYEDLFLECRKMIGFGFWIAMSVVGPGMALVKVSESIDVSSMSGDELANLCQKILLEWIDQHPENGREMAKTIVNLVKEYKSLELK